MSLPHLVLSGFMGVGKTTVGRIVAAEAGVPFVDLDESILEAERAAGRAWPTCAALFEERGEPAFRRLEAEALSRALDAPAPSVIAPGGGALLAPASRERALRAARVVTLTAPAAVHLERVRRPDQPPRPLLATAADPAARIAELLHERSAAYAEAHATIATEGRSPETVAEAVVRAWRSPALVVRLGVRSYPVRFAGEEGAGAVLADVLASLRPSRWFLVTDTTVDRLWGEALLDEMRLTASPIGPPAAIVRLPPGETEKTLATVERIVTECVETGADRDALIVAHGGGVASDIAGFAASILLRGVRWISVPTTLLSMADAAIGGKTGVDIGPAKNAAGTFHQPSAVVIDVRRTATETPRALTSGLAEIAKSGAIADPLLVELLERLAAASPEPSRPETSRPEPSRGGRPTLSDLTEAVFAAAAVKIAIVSADERETGPRALLNFGHTLGHALEAAGRFERWTHGEAVSLGMAFALRAGALLGVTPEADRDRVIALLRGLGLPVDLPLTDVEAALPFLALDKKRRGGVVRAVFLTALGRAEIRPLPLDDLALLFCRSAADARGT